MHRTAVRPFIHPALQLQRPWAFIPVRSLRPASRMPRVGGSSGTTQPERRLPVRKELLSKNDLDQLWQALAAGREISVTRSLGELTMTASTCRGSPVWGCDMLIRLEQSRGPVYSTQYFRSVEEMMRYI